MDAARGSSYSPAMSVSQVRGSGSHATHPQRAGGRLGSFLIPEVAARAKRGQMEKRWLWRWS